MNGLTVCSTVRPFRQRTRSGDAPAITQAAITRHVTRIHVLCFVLLLETNSNSIRDN